MNRPGSVNAWLLAVVVLIGHCLSRVGVGQDLLTLVRSDVGICIEAHDLARRLPQARQSRFFRHLESLPLYDKWLSSPEFRKLDQARAYLETLAGKPFHRLAAELFGESVVVAIYPRAENDPAAVVLLRASSEAALADAVDIWNRLENAETRMIDYGDIAYAHRRAGRGDKSETQFYVQAGPVLAMSDREAMIQQVIDLLAPTAPVERLSESEPYVRARSTLAPETMISAYLNPRVWDAAVLKEEAPVQDEGDPFARQMRRMWKELDSAIVGVRVDTGVIVESILQYTPSGRSDNSAPESPQSRDPKFLKAVPDDAIIAAGGRIDLTALAEWSGREDTLLRAPQWQRFRRVARGLLMGRDLFDDVLPRLGPAWFAYAITDGPTSAPADMLLAIELSEEAEGSGEDSDSDSALDNALGTGLNLAAVARNSQSSAETAVVRSARLGEARLRWIQSLGPFEPGYAVSEAAAVIASSPELLRRYLDRSSTSSLVERPDFAALAASYFPAADQVLYADIAALRSFIRRHRRALIGHLSESESAQQQVDRLVAALSLFDDAFAAAAAEPGRLRITFGGVVREETGR